MSKKLQSNLSAQAEVTTQLAQNDTLVSHIENRFPEGSKLTYSQLIDDLASGCKPKVEWKLGLELEQFTLNSQTGAPVPYKGDQGIHALLNLLASDYGWETITENDLPIALKKNDINLTLEPGGQIEFSGSPQANLTSAAEEMNVFFADVDAAAKTCGLSFMRKGLHPQWSRDDIHWMPKGRYKIMREYMQKKGHHGLDMMIRSCGAQLNLDYADEADMVKKFRVALALQPFVIALMANSSELDGQETGYESFRAHVWTDTDPDRCGGLPFVFSDDMSFAKYVDYALDVPMYFIIRDGKYLDATGLSFRNFLNGTLPGFEGEYATLTDWQNHISTLFPDVRMKQYLELRGADSHEPEMVYAMTAFWVGALYNQTALDKLHSLVMSWPLETHDILSRHTAKHGLNPSDGLPFELMPYLYQIMEIVADGLKSEVSSQEEAELIQPFWNKMLELG